MTEAQSTTTTTAATPLEQFEVNLPTKPHGVVITLDAVSVGKRRNDVRVRMKEPWQRRDWELASDEPPAIGGEETAPMPLCIFATGVATCFMTQVRNFSRKRKVQVDGLQLSGKFEWEFIVGPSPTEPYTAKPKAVILDIEIDSESPVDDQKALIAAAARGCFAEAMLSVPVIHRLKSGEEWILCDVD